jgi:hypothetical protein
LLWIVDFGLSILPRQLQRQPAAISRRLDGRQLTIPLFNQRPLIFQLAQFLHLLVSIAGRIWLDPASPFARLIADWAPPKRLRDLLRRFGPDSGIRGAYSNSIQAPRSSHGSLAVPFG